MTAGTIATGTMTAGAPASLSLSFADPRDVPPVAERMAQAHIKAGGRVAFFLETDDFAEVHARMLRRGIKFLETPRHEPYGTVAVFEDFWGNRWDLIEPAEAG